jgi:hypothetical protein
MGVIAVFDFSMSLFGLEIVLRSRVVFVKPGPHPVPTLKFNILKDFVHLFLKFLVHFTTNKNFFTIYLKGKQCETWFLL